MTSREPLTDIIEEARQVLAGCAARDVSARLIGGLAVAMHQHTPTPVELQRSYADIDIVIGRKDGRGAKTALAELGYAPNDRFNALRGDRRLLFYDTVNGRQLDVFVGTFAMCHALDLSARLTLLPDTLGVADLGESRPQELWHKAVLLPTSVRWHLVGHLQRNKVERTVPLAFLIGCMYSIADRCTHRFRRATA